MVDLIWFCVGLTVGNIIYFGYLHKNYLKAFEISYAQAFALLFYYMVKYYG